MFQMQILILFGNTYSCNQITLFKIFFNNLILSGTILPLVFYFFTLYFFISCQLCPDERSNSSYHYLAFFALAQNLLPAQCSLLSTFLWSPSILATIAFKRCCRSIVADEDIVFIIAIRILVAAVAVAVVVVVLVVIIVVASLQVFMSFSFLVLRHRSGVSHCLLLQQLSYHLLVRLFVYCLLWQFSFAFPMSSAFFTTILFYF